MTAYRFRFKHEREPRALHRDIVVGADRRLTELKTTLNGSVGLDQGHLWFFGAGQSYWNSEVEFQAPAGYEESPDTVIGPGPETYDAGETTVGELVSRLDLDRYDRICYLYDFGDQWRFYAILKEILHDGPDDRAAELVDASGDDVTQYPEP